MEQIKKYETNYESEEQIKMWNILCYKSDNRPI